MASELKKASRVNTLIRLIGLAFIIIGALTIAITSSGINFLGDYHLPFTIAGIIILIVGLVTFTAKIE